MNTIFYCISILVVFILFCLIKKKENKIDIIPTIIITFLCILSYQMLSSMLFTMLNIPINLLSLTIINIFTSIALGILLYKKGRQIFKITKIDAIIALIIILIVSFITYKDVGKLENIKYYSTDASIHYISVKEFYQNEKMLNKTLDTETSKQMMPMAYVNVGILFKAFAPIIGEINLYKIFILFDITIFCFSGLLFYFIIKDKIEKKWHIVLACGITIIYLIGYPLNNLLCGFYYLGIGCLIISAILYAMLNIKQEQTIKRIIIFLLNTGLILSYSLFAPVVYLSIFIYDGYITYKKYNKILNKEFVLNTIITLIIPGLIGVIFLLAPNVEAVKALAIDGYIYKNLFINIIFFIPFVFYYFVKEIKEKDINYKTVYFCTLIAYMILIYICTKVKIVSEYYFFKNAYILWTILLIYFFYGIIAFIQKYQKEKIVAIVYIVVYILLLGISIITQKHLSYIFDIYENNITLINKKENLTQDDINMLSYIYDNNILSTTENNTLFIGDFMQEAWIRSIFKYCNRYPLEEANHIYYIEKWNNGETQYIVCFKASKTYPIFTNLIKLDEKSIIYQTEKAILYKNN